MSNYSAEEAANRKVALEFYTKAIVDWDFAAAAVHLGDPYVQHSPTVGDGREGLRRFVDGVPPPVKAMLRVDIRRVLVDGDLVAIHSLSQMPGTNGRAIVDLFRLADGKIVEHWDVVQDVPDTALHANGIA